MLFANPTQLKQIFKVMINTFTMSGKLELPEDEDFDLTKWIKEIIDKIKSLWKQGKNKKRQCRFYF